MIEKDNIQELFSKAFENHTSLVRPDLWSGVQAKMSAAGVAGGSAAVKGISALTKWIVGTAAVTTIGVTAYVVTNNSDTPKIKEQAPIVAASPNTTPSETPIQNKTEADNKTTAFLNPSNNTEAEKEQMVIHNIGPNPSNINFHPNDDIRSGTEYTSYYEPAKTVTNPASVVNNSNNKTNVVVGSTSSSTAVENKETQSATASSSEENKTPQIAEAKIELPNIFTPNGDRANDLCQFLKIENVKSVEVIILDQDSKPVFKSDDINFAWDGTLANGDQARIGIYTVLIAYTDMADEVKTKKPANIYLQR